MLWWSLMNVAWCHCGRQRRDEQFFPCQGWRVGIPSRKISEHGDVIALFAFESYSWWIYLGTNFIHFHMVYFPPSFVSSLECSNPYVSGGQNLHDYEQKSPWTYFSNFQPEKETWKNKKSSAAGISMLLMVSGSVSPCAYEGLTTLSYFSSADGNRFFFPWNWSNNASSIVVFVSLSYSLPWFIIRRRLLQVFMFVLRISWPEVLRSSCFVGLGAVDMKKIYLASIYCRIPTKYQN